jgi:rhodanese-related sulfurtransferase
MFMTRRNAAQHLFSALVLLGTGAATAADDRPDTPASLPGGKVISVDEGKKLLDGKSAMFIDMRSAMGFGKGHVPGAVSVDYKEKSDFVANFDAALDTMDVSKLPADKTKTLVFYGHGAGGCKGYKGAVLSVKAGYKNVMFMRDGWSGWESEAYVVER